MIHILLLLLPGLIPSWQFFKTVEPSPRVQWRYLSDDGSGDWRSYTQRPNALPLTTYIKRLFWNPDWNDALFMASLSERLMEQETGHSLHEIQRRISIVGAPENPQGRLQFRILFISRDGHDLVEEVTYLSAPWTAA